MPPLLPPGQDTRELNHACVEAYVRAGILPSAWLVYEWVGGWVGACMRVRMRVYVCARPFQTNFPCEHPLGSMGD